MIATLVAMDAWTQTLAITIKIIIFYTIAIKVTQTVLAASLVNSNLAKDAWIKMHAIFAMIVR